MRPRSDAGIQAKTGKTYTAWFAILDALGARKMTHKEMVAILDSQYRLGRWWAQKIAIIYAHERGLRKKHETQSGYQITVSRTFPFSASKLYKIWHDKKVRSRWLKGDSLTLRSATANKTLRASWDNGKSRVEVGFYPKGQSKCQVVVRHTKLGGSAEASRSKKYWTEALDRLRDAHDMT
jgi:uncharacterized protein YndB with AHSA1/START domain